MGVASLRELDVFGWPAGEVETKKTMQWDGTKWVTATATPKAPLQNTGSDATPSTQDKSSSAWSAPKIEPRIEFSIPKTIYSDISYDYASKTFLEYNEAYNGVFLWNMGDGTVYKSNKNESIKHTYKYPGTYTISFAYYKNPYDKKPFLYSSVEKTVTSPKIVFSIVEGKGFQFSNIDTVPVDISDWVIILEDKTIELPAFTIIGPNRTVIMPFSVFSLVDKTYTKATLETPERTTVSTDSTENLVKSKSVTISKSSNIQEPSIIEDINVISESPLHKEVPTKEGQKLRSPAKIIIFAGLLVTIICLFIFSEHLKAKQEE
jgi:hypothetical protein